MKALIWNIRGIQNTPSISRLKLLIKKYDISFLAVIEPKAAASKIGSFKRKLRMSGCLVNSPAKGRIWIFWRTHCDVSLIEASDQFITVSINAGFSCHVLATIVHASCSLVERRALWDYLVDFSGSCNSPWLVGGDFNSILDLMEKRGGKRAFSLSMSDFQACISATGLQDAGFQGCKFTWFNGQHLNGIWARLDRLLLNGHWHLSCPAISVQHLSRACSDHCPLLISADHVSPKGPSRFSFQHMWTAHEKFLDDSRKAWSSGPLSSYPILTVALKLKHMKEFYRAWNKEIFKNVQANVATAEAIFEDAEQVYDSHPSVATRTALSSAKDQLDRVLSQEEMFWRQRSRIKWLKEGDHNTKFFHAYASSMIRKSSITKLQSEDGSVVEDISAVASMFVTHFQNAFTSEPVSS